MSYLISIIIILTIMSMFRLDFVFGNFGFLRFDFVCCLGVLEETQDWKQSIFSGREDFREHFFNLLHTEVWKENGGFFSWICGAQQVRSEVIADGGQEEFVSFFYFPVS